MTGLPPAQPGADDMREELRAVLHAGRELPAAMDDTVIDAFVRRLDQHIDDRIRALAPVSEDAAAKHVAAKTGAVTGMLAVGIPLVVLAGVFGHVAGVVIALLVIGGLAGYSLSQ